MGCLFLRLMWNGLYVMVWVWFYSFFSFLLVLVCWYCCWRSMMGLFILSILYLQLYVLGVFSMFFIALSEISVVHNDLLGFVWSLFCRLVYYRNRLQTVYYMQLRSFLSFLSSCVLLYYSWVFYLVQFVWIVFICRAIVLICYCH